jgi:hypothetical protein
LLVEVALPFYLADEPIGSTMIIVALVRSTTANYGHFPLPLCTCYALQQMTPLDHYRSLDKGRSQKQTSALRTLLAPPFTFILR